MLRIALGFASREGQTEKIAHHVARRIENGGHVVRLMNIKAHQLNVVERYVLHRILAQKGVARDPSGDTELTNWSALDLFVRDFIESAKPY